MPQDLDWLDTALRREAAATRPADADAFTQRVLAALPPLPPLPSARAPAPWWHAPARQVASAAVAGLLLALWLWLAPLGSAALQGIAAHGLAGGDEVLLPVLAQMLLPALALGLLGWHSWRLVHGRW